MAHSVNDDPKMFNVASRTTRASRLWPKGSRKIIIRGKFMFPKIIFGYLKGFSLIIIAIISKIVLALSYYYVCLQQLHDREIFAYFKWRNFREQKLSRIGLCKKYSFSRVSKLLLYKYSGYIGMWNCKVKEFENMQYTL